jgi:hypothetical protein
MIFRRRSEPHEVFTPRSPIVNEEMYVDRSELEYRLQTLLRETKHIIIHGESGNGKTWLYKKLFAEERVPYVTVNLANASRFGSISAALKDKIKKNQRSQQDLVQIVVNRVGSVKPGGIGGEVSDQRIYDVAEKEPLEALMLAVRRSSGRKDAFLVLDNFETVVDQAALVKELSDVLILLDDEDYAQYRVKICIVGVPSDIKEYLSKQNSLQSLSNRLSELPEVARLTEAQARQLLERGLADLLRLKLVPKEEVIKRILWHTDRIAQYLHEFGLESAKLARLNNDQLDLDVVQEAEKVWFDGSLSAVKQTVDHNMNARETKAGRRNQVLFALGCVKTEDFRYTDIESLVRREFPETTQDVELNIIQRLGELENSPFPVIKRVPRGDAYRVINPKTKIAIRVMLQKKQGRVEKVPHIT